MERHNFFIGDIRRPHQFEVASSNKGQHLNSYRPQDAHYNVVSPVLRRQQWSKVAPEVEAVDGPSRVRGLFRL